MPSRDRWAGPLPLLATIIAGWALHVRALSAGFILDDYHQLAALEHDSPLRRPFWDMYSFFRTSEDFQKLLRVGRLPWWTDPAMRLSFFRPLTGATFALDHALFGRHAVLWHVDTMLWWTAMVLAAAWALRDTLSPRAAALAVLVFALDEAHTVPVTWLANRHSVVATTFVLFALGWLERKRLAASWVAFALALAAGEYAISGLAFIFAWLLLDRSRTWRLRVAAFVPYLALTALYGGVRQVMGYGVRRFPVYVDPIREMREAPAWLSHQLGRLLGDLALGIPEDAPRHLWIVPTAIAMLVMLWRLAPEVEAWLLGSLIALVPVGFAIAGPRQLVLPCVGVAAAVGIALDRALDRATRSGRQNTALALAVLLPLGAMHLVWAPFVAWSGGTVFPTLHAAIRRAVLAAPVRDEDSAHDVVLLNVGDPTTLLYFAEIRHIEGGHALPRACWTLTSTSTREMLRRVAPDTFELRGRTDTGLIGTETARLFRRRESGFSVGDTVQSGAMRVTVIATGPLGPSWLRVQFDRSLDDPSLRFLVLTPQGIRPFDIPPVSYSTWLPPAVDASTIP